MNGRWKMEGEMLDHLLYGWDEWEWRYVTRQAEESDGRKKQNGLYWEESVE